MNRPSFQFYPADWLSNKNLRRCSFHLKGVWTDLMCLLHDSEEYGILRWTLQEIANAVGCSISDLNDLLRYGVLKGKEKDIEKVSFSTTISKKNSSPEMVSLINDCGPLYYSSRMVRDEYIRKQRAQHGIKSLDNSNVPRKKDIDTKKEKVSFSTTEKDTFSPSPSSSSSSSSSSSNINTITADKKKSAKKEHKEVDSRIKQFIDFAFQEHKKKFGQPLFITNRKDGELVKNLLKTFDLPTLQSLYIDMLNSDDPFFQDAGYGINVFCSVINKLAVNHGKPNRGKKLTYEEMVEKVLAEEEAKANGRI